MTPDRRETVETTNMPDRELLLSVYHQVVEIGGQVAETNEHLTELNGTVTDHCDEIHGNEAKQIPGMKPQLLTVVAYIAALRTTVKVVAGMFTVLIPLITVMAAKVF